jgi:hypothetical protein
MCNVTFGPEDCVIGRELFIPESMLNRFIKYTLLPFVPTLPLKMRREIATASTKTSTTTPFAFGSRLDIRKWIDRLCK